MDWQLKLQLYSFFCVSILPCCVYNNAPFFSDFLFRFKLTLLEYSTYLPMYEQVDHLDCHS